MSCEHSNKLKGYLEENLAGDEMSFMEGHIGGCDDCRRRLDHLLEDPLELPAGSVAVDDETLISKLKAHRKGIRRITVYGILGFILGLFSRFYTADSFIVTKAIMALPYKLAEFGLSIFFSSHALSPWELFYSHFPVRGMGFFPYQPGLDLAAELVTPAIIAAFGAITVAYLVSDRRVFHRKKLLRFLALGALVFLAWTAGLYGIYARTTARIGNLEGIRAVTIYSLDSAQLAWLANLDERAASQPQYTGIFTALAGAQKMGQGSYPGIQEGFELWIDFSGGGRMPARLDPRSGEMVMHNGNRYQVSADLIKQLSGTIGGQNHDPTEN